MSLPEAGGSWCQGWRGVPLTPVSGTGQALSLSKGVNGSRTFVAFPARVVRQAHHERERGLQPCKASIFIVVTRAADSQRRSPNPGAFSPTS